MTSLNNIDCIYFLLKALFFKYDETSRVLSELNPITSRNDGITFPCNFISLS